MSRMRSLLHLSYWLFASFSIVLNVGAFIPLNVGVVSKQKCFVGTSDIRHSFQAKKDIVIIGGSLAGLSIALELATSTNDVQVTVLDSTVPATEQSEVEFGKTNIASMAAAGMLAPMSERLPSGPLLDLCLDSRAMYGSWVEKVEQLAQASTLGKKYLWNGSEYDVGYRCNGGFLAPAFAGDGVATWAPPVEGGEAIWLDHSQIMEMENSLNPEIVGGWWFPTDASVDARRLTCSLRAACANSGVELCFGDDYRVKGIDQSDKKNIKVLVESGITYEPKKVIAANGAWMKHILPIPIVPHKGQSLSVTLEEGESLERVLFAQDTYIVPKSDGRIIVGATVEPNTFDSDITPAGLTHIIENACELLPSIARGKIGEVWCGLRPTTPDKAPILGTTKHEQLFVAGGYWRNGVLLAPKTAQLMCDLVTNSKSLSKSDESLLEAFNWDRFYNKEKSRQLEADIRYKSQMHTIQYRGKGSATAGVELGFYEGARAAKNERQTDRNLLWGDADEDSIFEQAALKGLSDATSFILKKDDRPKESLHESSQYVSYETTFPDLLKTEQNDSALLADTTQIDSHEKTNAITIGMSENGDEALGNANLSDTYAAIKSNKEAAAVHDFSVHDEDDKNVDIDFDIHWVDPESGESILVPPGTSPGDFHSTVSRNIGSSVKTLDPDETTFDGYTEIQAKNSRGTRAEELEAMRASRISNRDRESEACNVLTPTEKEGEKNELISDLDKLYESIRRSKSEKEMNLPVVGESSADTDLGFEIFWNNPDTGERELVPQGTSPGKFFEQRQVENKKKETVGNDSSSISDNTQENPNAMIPDETTFDGYTVIQAKNSRSTRAEELEAMRAARISNRGMPSDTFGS